MKVRAGRAIYRDIVPDWGHWLVVTLLYAGIVTMTVIKEVRMAMAETKTWAIVIKAILLGSIALLNGLPLILRRTLARGYPPSSPLF